METKKEIRTRYCKTRKTFCRKARETGLDKAIPDFFHRRQFSPSEVLIIEQKLG